MPDMPARATICRCLSIVLLLIVCRVTARDVLASEPSLIESRLRDRLEARPNDASTWRLLGRVLRQQGDENAARNAFRRAVVLDPESAAAHFDLGRTLLTLDHADSAAGHFRNVVELAPESTYAREARDYLAALPDQPGDSQIIAAGFESKRFDGSNLAKSAVYRPATRW